uniref:Uncharacterized protein n=1 Tax=Anopheles minimus TaxID=112268 RepID=A0A182WN17_9DIPT
MLPNRCHYTTCSSVLLNGSVELSYTTARRGRGQVSLSDGCGWRGTTILVRILLLLLITVALVVLCYLFRHVQLVMTVSMLLYVRVVHSGLSTVRQMRHRCSGIVLLPNGLIYRVGRLIALLRRSSTWLD